MPVTVGTPDGDKCPTAPACGTDTSSGQNGRYMVYVPAGTYTLQTSDAGQPTTGRTVVAQAGAVIHAPIALPATPVPAGTTAHRAARDLRRLNAERTADGLPADLTLAPRWSAECAAHDDYERTQWRAHEHREPGLARRLGRRRLGGTQQRPRPGPLDPPARTRGRTRRSICSRCSRPACRSSGSTTTTATSASPPIRGSCVRRRAPTGSPPTPPMAPRTLRRPSVRVSHRSSPDSSSGSRAAAPRAASCSSISTSPTRPGRHRFRCCRPSSRPEVIRWRCAGSTPRHRPSAATCRARS